MFRLLNFSCNTHSLSKKMNLLFLKNGYYQMLCSCVPVGKSMQKTECFILSSELGDIIISFSVNRPSRTLAAHQTPKVRVLNLPLTSQAVTRVSGSSRPCNSRAAICLLTGGREKQHIVNKQLSSVPSVFCLGVR